VHNEQASRWADRSRAALLCHLYLRHVAIIGLPDACGAASAGVIIPHVGTWGTGPFGSDGAQDLLAALAGQTPMQRTETIGSILAPGAMPADRRPPDLWDTEVIAAAAVVAANVSGEGFDSDPERALDVADYLPKPLDPALVATALQALIYATAPGTFWSTSWADDDLRREAIEEHDRVREALTNYTGL
jgi:hypothetical protein